MLRVRIFHCRHRYQAEILIILYHLQFNEMSCMPQTYEYYKSLRFFQRSFGFRCRFEVDWE